MVSLIHLLFCDDDNLTQPKGNDLFLDMPIPNPAEPKGNVSLIFDDIES